AEVLRQHRMEAADDLLRLDEDLLLHGEQTAAIPTGASAAHSAATAAAASPAAPTLCRDVQQQRHEPQQRQRQQQPLDLQRFEQLSPLPMSSCASGCSSPMQ